MSTVLVTGGSGFLGNHCVAQLLEAGHVVQTTVRSPKRQADLLGALREAGVDPGERLRFFVADLQSDAGWTTAVAGCEYVLHVASPFPMQVPTDANELIVPARDGTLRVLRAARNAGVKRVVLTSSFAAIGYGHAPQEAPFNESSWTNLDADVAPYIQSKTIAERAAWEFIAKEGDGLELSVINPVGIFGPALAPEISTSIRLTQMLINGGIPGCPNLFFGAVDVRDVASMHVTAMTHPAAAGERFLAIAGDVVSIHDIALLVKPHLGPYGKRIPTGKIPDWIIRALATVVPAARQIATELGSIKRASSAKAMRVLDWTPRSKEEAILATADSLVRLGLVKDAPKPA